MHVKISEPFVSTYSVEGMDMAEETLFEFSGSILVGLDVPPIS